MIIRQLPFLILAGSKIYIHEPAGIVLFIMMCYSQIMQTVKIIETRRFRIKNKHEKKLEDLASKVNYVWNYCNATQRKHFRDHPEKRFLDRYLSYYDLGALTSGTSKLLNLPSETIKSVCKQYTQSLSIAKNKNGSRKAWLRFRNSKKPRWIPFKAAQIRRLKNGKFRFFTGYETFELQTMHYENMPENFKLKDGGSFVCDKTGKWHVNFVIEYEPDKHYHQSNKTVGIDPGLNHMAVLSNGRKIEAPRYFRDAEDEIAKIQSRAKRDKNNNIISRKTNRVLAKKHARIGRQRAHFYHTESKKITDAFPEIKVGDLSPSWLLQSGRGKSASDIGLYSFKDMLRYKSERNGGAYYEVNEAYSSQVCSNCGTIPDSSPKGEKDLGIRQWVCSNCRAEHDRDVNAAVNIARLVPQTPAEGAGSLRASDRSGDPCNVPEAMPEAGSEQLQIV